MRMAIEMRSVNVEAESAGSHLRVLVTGAYDFADFRALVREALAECARYRHDRAFFDITAVTGEMPDLDRYDLGEQFAREWGQFMRAAILVDSGQRVNKLFETVAINRSAQVQVGFHEETLMGWLLAG
jgi:hypothetical protein